MADEYQGSLRGATQVAINVKVGGKLQTLYQNPLRRSIP